MSTSGYPIPVVLLLSLLSQPTLAADDDTITDTENQKPRPCKYCPDDTGWSGWVEGGVGSQSEDSYHFGRYTGYEDEGTVFNGSGELNYRDEHGNFLEGRAEDLGIKSRRIRVEGGKQGKYEIGIEYDQIPNYREKSSFSPFSDQGGGRLGLPADWVPGSTTDEMPSLGNDLRHKPLETKRDRTGAKFIYYPSRRWEVSGYARHEKKDGDKDMGATFGFSQAVILPVPFKYETDEFGMTLGYNDEKFQSEISYTASLFDNDQEAIIWDNPYEDASSDTALGRLAESPDNEFHQISAILGYQLRPDTRIGARLARGRMTQDEDYLPYSINPIFSSDALPTDNLDGEVNTTLASVEVNTRPLPQLRLDASYTYSDRDNDSSVNVYDYVVTDSSAGGKRENRTYSYEQNLLRLKAGYRFPKNVNLSIGYDDDKMDRTHTSVDETHDKTLWGKLKLRPLDRLETTLKYAYSDRDASSFTPLSYIDPDSPDVNYYNNSLMRMYNMADRTRDKAGFGLAYTPIDRLSLGFDLDYFKDDYDEMYLGLEEAKGLTYTASLSYTFSETLAGSAFYTYDKLRSDQKGSEKLLVSQPDDLWVASDENLTKTVGLGITWMAIPEKLDLGAELAYADYTGNMDFAGSESLPELSSKLTSVNLHGTYRMTEQLSMRAEFRYEKYEEDDWTKDGVVNTLDSLLSLGTAPQDNTTTLGLVSLRYDF